MPQEIRPPSAETYREKIEARHRLALLRLHEGLAMRSDHAITPSLRAEYASRYRDLIGVAPENRELYRDALGRIVAGGGMAVQDVIDLIHLRPQANGSGPIDGTGAATED